MQAPRSIRGGSGWAPSRFLPLRSGDMFRGFFKRTARFFVVVAPPKKKEKRWGADVNQSEPRTRLFLGAERTVSVWEAL